MSNSNERINSKPNLYTFKIMKPNEDTNPKFAHESEEVEIVTNHNSIFKRIKELSNKKVTEKVPEYIKSNNGNNNTNNILNNTNNNNNNNTNTNTNEVDKKYHTQFRFKNLRRAENNNESSNISRVQFEEQSNITNKILGLSNINFVI